MFKTFITPFDAVLYTDDTALSIDLSDYHDTDPDGDTLTYYIQNANNQGSSSFSLSGTSKNLTFTPVSGSMGLFTSTVQWYTNVTDFGNSATKTVTVYHGLTGYKEGNTDLSTLYERGTHVGNLPISVTTSNYKVNGTDFISMSGTNRFKRETTTVNGSSNFKIKDDNDTYRTFDQIFKKRS